MSDDDLKAELVKKAKAAGVWNAQPSWSVETLERKISEAALRDQEEPAPEPQPEPELEGDETEPEEVEAVEEPEPGPEEAPEEPAEEVLEEKVSEPTPEPETQPEGTVRCRVTKKGHNKIFTGKQEPKHYAWEDVIFIPPEAARALEDRAFVEILDEPLD